MGVIYFFLIDHGKHLVKPPIACKSQSQRHGKEGHCPKVSIAASAVAEPPIYCKLQWKRHSLKGEPPPQGNRGKNYSKASYTLQITMAETRKGNRGKRYSSYTLQLAMTETRQGEPPPEGVNRGKRCSRASYRLANHNGRGTV